MVAQVADTEIKRVIDAMTGATHETTETVVPSHEPDNWPSLAPEALHGLAGEVVDTFLPQSEADPAAILVTVLGMFGNCVGRTPHTYVGETRHGTNTSVVIVGKSSRSRKGTSASGPKRVFQIVDDRWAGSRQIGGIGSGEGIIYAVRDPSEPKVNKDGTTSVEDPGIDDKRLMVIEEEISSLFTVSGRDGSIVGETIRKAWDGTGTLFNTVKKNPLQATNAHVSILGHITLDEIRHKLTETDKANGVANRFMFVLARRSKALPNPERIPDQPVASIARRVQSAIDHGRRSGEMSLSPEAKDLWARVYPILTEDQPGLYGAVIARAEAQVLRLSLIYAVMDKASQIEPTHMLSALALWRYCESSAQVIFGNRTGDVIADRIEDALRSNASGLQETEIHDLLGRHTSGGKIKASLLTLQSNRRARMVEEKTSGRPARRWFAIPAHEAMRSSDDYLGIARQFTGGAGLSSHSSLYSHVDRDETEDGDVVVF